MTQPAWAEMDGDARRAACLAGRTAGLSGGQMASKFQCSRNAVIGILHRMEKAGVKVPASPHHSIKSTKVSPRTGMVIVPAKAEPPAARIHVNSAGILSEVRSRLDAAQEYHPVIARANAFDPIPGTKPISLMKCGPRSCRMAVDGLHGPSRLFCGADKDPDQSWCPAHRLIVYQPPEERGRRQRIATATVVKEAA